MFLFLLHVSSAFAFPFALAFAFPFALGLYWGEVTKVGETREEEKETWTTTKTKRLETLENKAQTNAQAQALEAAEETWDKKTRYAT